MSHKDRRALIVELHEKLKLGRCSHFWPYLKHLTQDPITSPAMWTQAERTLLDGLPFGDETRFESAYAREEALVAAHGNTHYAGRWAMTPVYDMFNHRNGK